MTPAETAQLIRRFIGGEPAAAGRIHREARTSADPLLLAAAALIDPGAADLLARATAAAVSSQDRQLVVLVSAHLAGDRDRANLLARDHLADHPDSVLASWIAAESTDPTAHNPQEKS
jgi:hypothetical protein